MGVDDYILKITEKEKELERRIDDERRKREEELAGLTEEWRVRIKRAKDERLEYIRRAEDEAKREVELEMERLLAEFESALNEIKERSMEALEKAISFIVAEAKKWA